MKNRNHILLYTQTIIYNFVLLLVGGSIFQTFLLESGLDESQVSTCVSVLQMVQTLTILLLSGLLDRIRKILTWVAVCFFSNLLPLGAMLVLCLWQDLPVNGKYLLILCPGVVFNFIQGIYYVISYKMPHHIMDIADYGKVTGQSGALAGLAGIGATAALTFFLSRFSYFGTMTTALLLGALCTAVVGSINFFFIPYHGNGIQKNPKKIHIFRYKPFYQLAIPNFSRGISQGVFTLITVIGYHRGILDSSAAALMVTISQIAMLLGCQSFAFISSRQKNALLALLSGIALAIFMPLMALGGRPLFILLYFVTYLLSIYISYVVPVIVAKRIDYDCLGQYTAWRMLLLNLGTALGSALVPILLEWTGAFGTLLIGGLAMLPCGIGYYLFEHRFEKQSDEDKESDPADEVRPLS